MKKKVLKKIKSADAIEIAKLRLETGLDQPEFAKIVKRGIKTVSNWENAKKPLKEGTVDYVKQKCLEYLETTRTMGGKKGQNKPPQRALEEMAGMAGIYPGSGILKQGIHVVRSSQIAKPEKMTMSQKDMLIELMDSKIKDLEAEITILKKDKEALNP